MTAIPLRGRPAERSRSRGLGDEEDNEQMQTTVQGPPHPPRPPDAPQSRIQRTRSPARQPQSASTSTAPPHLGPIQPTEVMDVLGLPVPTTQIADMDGYEDEGMAAEPSPTRSRSRTHSGRAPSSPR
eukprot:5758522-Amphidinium_carterae.1